MSNNEDIHKKQFYSKIKTAKKLNSQLINWEKLKLYRLLLNFDETAKFQKVLNKELEELILNLLTWEQIAMLYIHSWYHLQSLVRKI